MVDAQFFSFGNRHADASGFKRAGWINTFIFDPDMYLVLVTEARKVIQRGAAFPETDDVLFFINRQEPVISPYGVVVDVKGLVEGLIQFVAGKERLITAGSVGLYIPDIV